MQVIGNAVSYFFREVCLDVVEGCGRLGGLGLGSGLGLGIGLGLRLGLGLRIGLGLSKTIYAEKNSG